MSINGVNTVYCGYCQNEVMSDDRYPIYLRSKGVSIPAYLHNSCGVKVGNLGENVWHFHKLSWTYQKKINKQDTLF
jgi:hypothetical protein